MVELGFEFRKFGCSIGRFDFEVLLFFRLREIKFVNGCGVVCGLLSTLYFSLLILDLFIVVVFFVICYLKWFVSF